MPTAAANPIERSHCGVEPASMYGRPVAPTRNGVKGQRRLSGRLWVELAGYRRSYLFEMFKRDLGFSGTVKPTSSAQHFLISRNSFAARGYRARSKTVPRLSEPAPKTRNVSWKND